MVRPVLRASGTVARQILLSAALSSTFILTGTSSGRAQDAASEPATEVAAQPAVAEPASAAPAAEAAKNLHTVPEDGMGDIKWLSGATRIVREITLKRPTEDLVICVAGCVGKQDRVVYAQPAEIVTKPEEIASEAAPVTPSPKVKAAAKPDAVKADTMKADAAQADAPKGGPIAPENSAAEAAPLKAELQPTASEPAAVQTPALPAAAQAPVETPAEAPAQADAPK